MVKLFDDDDRKCSTCKKTKPVEEFPASSKCCETCVAYRREYNQRKRDERAQIPTKICEICNCKIKLEHWDNHYNLPSHIITRLRKEYRLRIEQAEGKEKKRLEKEMEEKSQEIRDTLIPWYKTEPEKKTDP